MATCYGRDGLFIGLPGHGASAPDVVLFEKFGVSPPTIADAVRRSLD